MGWRFSGLMKIWRSSGSLHSTSGVRTATLWSRERAFWMSLRLTIEEVRSLSIHGKRARGDYLAPEFRVPQTKALKSKSRTYRRCILFASLGSSRQNGLGNITWENSKPLYLEIPFVPEESSPGRIADDNLDAKAALSFVVPFANIGDAGKDHWEGKTQQPLVKGLRARARPQPAI